MATLGGDDVWLNQRSNAERIVHRRRLWNIHLLAALVTADASLDYRLGRHACRCAERAECRALFGSDERLMRGVEWHHQHILEAGLEDARSSFGVGPDIELRRGGHVRDLVTATHDDQLRHPLGEARLLRHCGGNVGQRPDRHQRDRLSGVAIRFDQVLHGALRGWLAHAARNIKIGAVWVLHAVCLEESLRRHRLAHEWPRESRMHRNMPLADQLQDRE